VCARRSRFICHFSASRCTLCFWSFVTFRLNNTIHQSYTRSVGT
jgi:Zn-finger protein